VRDGLRVVGDELTHSELSAGVAAAAGGADVPVALEQAALDPLPGADPFVALVTTAVETFCLGETVAVPLFRMFRDRCTVAVARAALDRIVRDEARHRAFGWDLLDWLLLVDEPRTLGAIDGQVPAMLHRLEAAYAGDDDHDADDPDAEWARAWGVVPAHEYAPTLQDAIRTQVVPRLATRGLSA
jgi:hypothetical protein